MADRTERSSTRTAKSVTVTRVSLAALMAFGAWVAKEVRDTAASQRASVSVDRVDRYVTEERWRNDSTRRDEQFRTLINEVRDLRTDNAQRLREICVALRAGCR
jgi:hypothetical protein